MPEDKAPRGFLARFRRWVIWSLVGGIFLYVGGTLWAGSEKVGDSLAGFQWWLFVPVLLLTLVNYSLRFLKWHFLLRLLKVPIGWKENVAIFTAGLSMVISPGKAGELLKPYLVSKKTGVTMARTLPALVIERLTDAVAVLALAAISVGTFAADKTIYLLLPALAVALVVVVLASKRLSQFVLAPLHHIPRLARHANKAEEMLEAMRSCLSPLPFIATILISVVAWWAECVGYMLVFRGLGVAATLEAPTFIYAFATVAGGAFPGGLGGSEAALAGGASVIMGVPDAIAVSAAVLIRVATLWFGVLLGALALLRFEKLLGGGIAELAEDA